MTKEELIALARKGIQKKEQEEKNRKAGNYTRDYEDVTWAGLDDKKPGCVRFLGKSYEKRENNFDPKFISISRIVGDDNKLHKFVFPNKDEQKDYFIWKVMTKICEGKWDSNLNGGKGGMVYYNQLKYPDLLNRVLKNGKENANIYEQGWKPLKTMIFNVIDYTDDWCKTNKHAKLLARKINIVDDKIYATEGIPYQVYKNLFSDLVENYGWYDEYQTVILKNSTEAEYKLYHLVEDGRKKAVVDTGYASLIKNDFSDESDYKLYDLDKLFPVSSYQKIMKCLGTFIKEVDGCLKTKFFEELEKLVAEEKIKFEQIYGKKESDEVSEEMKEVKDTYTMGSIRGPKVETKVEVKENKFNPLDYTELFPHLADLTETELAFIVGFDDANGEFIFSKEAGSDSACPVCKDNGQQVNVPMNINTCYNCGKSFN